MIILHSGMYDYPYHRPVTGTLIVVGLTRIWHV